jgi:HEAT repeat protein
MRNPIMRAIAVVVPLLLLLALLSISSGQDGLIRLLDSQDRTERERAAEELAELGSTAALTSALLQPTDRVREAGAHGLGWVPLASRPSIVPNLVAALDDPAPSVRAKAAWALSRVGRAAFPAAPDLLKLLDDDSPAVRFRAGEALLVLDPEYLRPALPYFLRDLRSDSLMARTTAVRGVARLGSSARGALPDLQVIASSDPVAQIRRLAKTAIRRIGGEYVSPTPVPAKSPQPVPGDSEGASNKLPVGGVVLSVFALMTYLGIRRRKE